MFNHVEKDGSWYCLLHRYPPCCVCRTTPRPESAMQSKMKFKDWTCESCRNAQKAGHTTPQPTSHSGAHILPLDAAATPDVSSTPAESTAKRHGWHTCQECGKEVRTKDFRQKTTGHRISERCKACEFPTCAVCGKHWESKTPRRPDKDLLKYENAMFPSQSVRWYCETKKECQAQRPRPCYLCHEYRESDMFRKWKNDKE